MKEKEKDNIILFISLTLLLLISCIGLANFTKAYLIKQIIWIILGWILLIIAKNYNIKIIIKYSFLIYLFNNILLLVVLFVGRDINGARAWFTFKGLSIQPSELMKISLAFVYYNLIKNNKDKDLILLIKIVALFFLPSLLVFLEPDTGAIIIYFIMMLTALFNSSINKKYIITISIIGLISIVLLTFIYIYDSNYLINLFGTSIFYRLDRIIHFKNNYQLNQALIYAGSAGLFGHKDILYIPEAHTDFIYSFLIGRYGLLFGIVIITLYLVMDFILLNKAKKNLLIKFFLYTFVFNQIYNVLMNIGLLPIMGIPLPFLSYGGTNTIISLIFLGIILNKQVMLLYTISKENKQ